LISKIIQNALKQEDSLLGKFKAITKLLSFYNNLSKGLTSGKIYHTKIKQNPLVSEIINTLREDDLKLLDLLFKKDIVDFLSTKKLKSHLDFEQKINSTQIGFNTIFIEKPISDLWTTGKATFYIPTKKEFSNKVSIKFHSIPPIQVMIEFEKKNVKTFNIQKLSTKEVSFVLEPSMITNTVSEISIATDKLWLPNVVLGVKESMTLGICVKSIDVSYF